MAQGWIDFTTVEARPCTGPNCGRRIWWARTKKNGKWLPFDEEPVALKTENGLYTTWALVDLSGTHWATCPDAERFRR